MTSPENEVAEASGNPKPHSRPGRAFSDHNISSASSRENGPRSAANTRSGNRRSRPKVSRACDYCKLKKLRCTGNLPCDHCSNRGLECLYDAEYRRGRPPTPPASGTPKAQAHTRGDTVQGTPTPVPTSPLRKRQRRQPNPEQARESDAGEQQDPSEALTGNGYRSRASPEHETTEIEGQFYDITSNLAFLHRAWKRFSSQNASRNAGAAPDAHATSERSQPLMSTGDRPFAVYPNQPLVMPDRETAHQLFDFYFEQCVVTYRCLHQQTCVGLLDAVLDNVENNMPVQHHIGNSKAALVIAILAIARLRNEKISESNLTFSSFSNLTLSNSDQYFCEAESLTGAEVGLPRLQSVQARVLQVLYLLQTGRMNHAWYLFGMASSIVAAIGLHRKLTRSRNGQSTRSDYIAVQCARRTFWVVYIIDKYLSVVLGRPRLWKDDDITQEYPDTVNDEDISPQGPCLTTPSLDCHVDSLIAHAKIATIIDDISREVYSLKSVPRTERLAAAKRFCRQLREWRQDLPHHLGSIHPQSLIPCFRRQAIALKLAYCHAIMHANRPFILGCSDQSGLPALNESVAECISAARMTLETVNDIVTDGVLFHAFWWTPYATFCALAVVYVWEIQQKAYGGNVSDDPSLFELAERCHSHLAQSPSTHSPGPRYSIILEELRLEAKQGALQPRHQADSGSGDETAASAAYNNAPESLTQDSNMLNLDLGITLSEMNEASFPPLHEWQVADWLDLDSSAHVFGSIQWSEGMGLGDSADMDQGWELNTGD